MRVPKATAPKSVNSFKPGKFGVGSNAPIVDHNSFTDATPTIGGKSDTFNPGTGSAGVLPSGPPKYVQPKGVRPQTFAGKGQTNKRLP